MSVAAAHAAAPLPDPDHLDDLSSAELRALFLRLTGSPLPKFMRGRLMRLAVAHALREGTRGGLDPAARKHLDQLVRQIVPRGDTAPPKPNKRIRNGTRLIREWQGRVHEVTVEDDLFSWQGQRYRSLSQIARLITGTRWNGWVFFGLRKSGEGKAVDVRAAAALTRSQRRKGFRRLPGEEVHA
jgi:hypothetical protein